MAHAVLITGCPPEWIVELTRLRPHDDELVLAHVIRCGRCCGIYDRTVEAKSSPQLRELDHAKRTLSDEPRITA
jgi:hypothetical protein